MKKFNPIEYFTDVAKIRYTMAQMMQVHHIVDDVLVDNSCGKINPYYGRITPNGAFGVEFSHGAPSYLYTPYGRVKIDSAVHHCENLANNELLFKDLSALFGMVKVQSKFYQERVGEFGPWYTITSLPWKKYEKFPTTFKKLDMDPEGLMDSVMARIQQNQPYDDLVDYETEIQIDKIYAAVNERFKKKGHYEFMIFDSQDERKAIINTLQNKRRYLLTNRLLKQKNEITDIGLEK